MIKFIIVLFSLLIHDSINAIPLQTIESAKITLLDSKLDNNNNLIKDDYSWWVTTNNINPKIDGLPYMVTKEKLDNPSKIWVQVKVPAELTGEKIIKDGRNIIWYRRAFILPSTIEISLSIRLGEINDRDRVYLNGVLIGSTGNWQAKEAQAYDKQRIYELPPNVIKPGQVNVILIQVKGYFINEIGIYRDRTSIGPSSALLAVFNEENLFQIGLLMLYLGVGAYFLFLFIRQRSERENVYFGLFVLGLVIYHFLRTQYKYDLNISFSFLKKSQYTDLFTLVPLFYYFMRHYFLLPDKKVG